MDEHKAVILAALKQHRGDDAARARRAFRHMTPLQMTKGYGNSDKTCGEILREYEDHERKVDAAIAWVEQS